MVERPKFTGNLGHCVHTATVRRTWTLRVAVSDVRAACRLKKALERERDHTMRVLLPEMLKSGRRCFDVLGKCDLERIQWVTILSLGCVNI